MADPVSYLLIESGWSVVGPGGEEIGTVAEVDADEEKDIFSGIRIRASRFGATRFVPSELVAQIVEGRIELTVTADELQDLEE